MRIYLLGSAYSDVFVCTYCMYTVGRYNVLYIFENFILNGNSLKGPKFESNLSRLKISSGVL